MAPPHLSPAAHGQPQGFGPVTVQPPVAAQRPAAQVQQQQSAVQVQAQPVAQAKPAQAAAAASPAAAAGADTWTEHTAPDGRKYYFNKALNKSSWEKPAAMTAPQVDPLCKSPYAVPLLQGNCTDYC